ncbi:hypothetical protein RHMOL_Rhmol02G0123100 [Rhododendron molle]|uniref:Uncharacterized protein n=1 Tax=Rhododendron molle TaxID=49168 RepID=A0ACC0PPN9_RHOML|nr:hypothetical protein RHMOL_Rhmol02G0123100 [Rhododendron molle]
MDDYSFLISDSWSFENDIRSGESISYNSRNYRLEFSTDQGHEYPSKLKSIEKQFVVDMANSTAPREILNILKQKDPSNTTEIKSVYNAIYPNKEAKLDGLTPIQYVIRQSLEKEYLHQFLTNPYTNEITDIICVHPISLELSINFSSILIIDAMYKTNEYRFYFVDQCFLKLSKHIVGSRARKALTRRVATRIFEMDYPRNRGVVWKRLLV